MKKRSAKDSAKVDLSDIPELGDSFFSKAQFVNLNRRNVPSSNVVVIDADLRREFPNAASVNEALRVVHRLRSLGTGGRKKASKRKTGVGAASAAAPRRKDTGG